MKMHNIKGCTTFSLNVDGKEEIDMTHEERLQVIDKIYEWMKRTADKNLNYIIQGLTEYCGEYNVINDKHCDYCGDIIDENVLDLE